MNAKGYQLFELLLACSLIGFLSTISLAVLNGVADQQRLHAAAHTFVSALTKGRSHALAKNAAVRVYVNENRKSFALAGRSETPVQWQDLPQGVEFSSIPSNLPTFYSRGTASPGGSFVLANRRGQIRVVVSLTGRIRWERIG